MKKIGLILISLFLAGCGVVGSADYNKEDVKTIVESNNRFAFDLLEELTIEDEPNIFFSPTSIHLALSMTYNGAESETKDEMADVLYVDHLDLEDVNKAYQSFLGITGSRDYHATLNIANSIWLKEGYPFVDKFITNTEEYYQAEVHDVDFLDPKVADDINDWVSKHTNKKIEKMVENIRPDTVAYLLNAIYFKGDWEHPFNEEATFKDTFYLKDGTTKQHPFMSQYKLELNYLENDLFQAVELPYKDQELSMIVILSKEEQSLAAFYEELSFESWNTWKKQFKPMEGDLRLPKFMFEYEANLNDVLIDLGMPTAFSNQADFSQMVENGGVYISEVKHKSFIDVNETGTEAAAATSVAVVEMAMPNNYFYMHVNRPFFFVIQDNETGMILFMGEVGNPVIEE